MKIFPYISLLRGRDTKWNFRPMTSRATRCVAVTLSVWLLTGGPVHAAPVAISEVIQVLGSYQNPPELRLRSLTQTASTPISGVKGSTVTSGLTQSSADGPGVNSNAPQRGVEIIDQGEVDGTICDCGEILIPVGGFPKWPLLFLAAIPFFFIGSSDDIQSPSFTPTPPIAPTPTTSQTPIPEPASLLLFGSGLAALGAGLRRRYARLQLAMQIEAAKGA